MNKVVVASEPLKKKIVPIGEFFLLKEYKLEEKAGTVLLAESAKGDKKYEIVNVSAEVDTELEIGDIVFVQLIDLIPVTLGEKEKFFMAKGEDIMGYEE